MNASETKARALVAERTTYQLIADWEELEKRDGKAFDAWLESCAVEGPRKFYIGDL